MQSRIKLATVDSRGVALKGLYEIGKTWLPCSRNRTTFVYGRGLVLQFSSVQVNLIQNF